MTFNDFNKSLNDNNPPIGISEVLVGLWYDAKGNWNKAHELIDGNSAHGADWAHAYLHRKEGDQWNADYWYRRAGKTKPSISLDDEWEDIVRNLCDAF